MPPQPIIDGIDIIIGIMRAHMSMNMSCDMPSGAIIFIIMPSFVISQDIRHIIIGIMPPIIMGFIMPPIIIMGFIIGFIIIGFIIGIIIGIMPPAGISDILAMLIALSMAATACGRRRLRWEGQA